MKENPEPTTEILSSRADFAAGHRIDRYELRELIGSGGMGSVYRAIDTKLGRTVALKTVGGRRKDARLTDRVRRRFLREAMALSKVEHRNVVQVMDFGFADDGTPFLVMEHLRGRDLGTLLDERDTPPTVAYVVDIMLGVCAALRACHRVGIVHRDLKPGNIFLVDTDTGAEVKVLDFGVSKAPTSDDLTREGQIVGTPQYLAPEQVDGKVGPASDQYALGVLIYACLTLRLPFEEHRNFDLLRAIETGRFESPRRLRPDLPQALERIVLRAMHVSPTERFESVYALGQELWALASPRGKDEWANYYFPCASVERALSKTQILTGAPSLETSTPGGALLYLSTKLARARSPDPEVATPVEPARQPSGTTDVGGPGGRLHLPAVFAGVAFVAAGFWAAHGWVLHCWTPPGPRAPAVPALESSLGIGLAGGSTPRAVPPPPAPKPIPVPAPAAPPERGIAPAPPETATPQVLRRAHAPMPRRHTPFDEVLPNIDHNGIGIPTD